MSENEISYIIRGSIFRVYNELGAGLLEKIYQAALKIDLENQGLKVREEVAVPVYYQGKDLGVGLRLDLLVENKVIIELKSVEELQKIHHKQLLTYLKITNLKLGILVNFNTDNISSSIKRKVNDL